jgi:ComB9 competence protein
MINNYKTMHTTFLGVLFFCLSSVICPLSSGTDIPKPHKDDIITTVTENPDIEQQIKGNYPELERVESQPLGSIQRAWDKASPSAGVYQVVYRPSEVIRFRTREYMTTTIILPQWEQITDIILGDETAYEVKQPKPHLILIRPQEFVGIDSTLTLIGASGRIYSFYMRTEGYNSKNISDVSVYVRVPIRDREPVPAQAGNRGQTDVDQTSAPDYLEDAYVNPSELSFDFTMAGDPEIAPERVYSDGIRTWFDYGSNINKKSLPTIYKVEDEIDTPINVNREGSKLVAQAVGNFCLKHGNQVTCVTDVRNQMSDGR